MEMKKGDLVKFSKLPEGASDNIIRCNSHGWIGMIEAVTAEHCEIQIPAKVSDGGPLPIFHHMGIEKVKVPLDTVEVIQSGMISNIERKN